MAREEERTMKRIKRFLKDEEGATAVEYGLIIAAIAAGIITVVYSIGGKIKTAFQTVDDNLKQ
jgi:pilus assembly protein Flp/PilA